MRIAFCHNLKTGVSLEEAEYDTQDTVDRLTRALESGGHEVHPIDMNGPVSRLSARLEALRPDLIFNTAEGRTGRLREAFFPLLFEHLKIPFTGGDAFCCALTLDKLATKKRAADHGVPTPKAVLVMPLECATAASGGRDLRFPVIAKPNYEGSSIGISCDSVFEDLSALDAALPHLIETFPCGILLEEFIAGRDITVGFLEALDPPVLDPTGYTYLNARDNPRNIYDYRLKNHASDEVQVDLDPRLEPSLARRIREWTRLGARALEVRDVGRFDFRIAPDGAAYFLEANALPSLEDGAGLLLAAGKRGLSYDRTILTIVESAARRYGIPLEGARHSRGPHSGGLRGRRGGSKRIGLTFNLKRADTSADDSEAEFDSPKTIAGLRAALEELGHEVVELEALRDLPSRLAEAQVDLVFNIAEGTGGRNRESHVPSLCEFLGLPHTGSDATTLSICLDKALAKRLLLQAGIPTPGFLQMLSGEEELGADLRFPLIAKPNAEGTSKGLDETSVVEDERSLRALVRRLLDRYRQPVIVEEYVQGREITVGLVGWPRPRVLAPMEVVFVHRSVKHPVYHYQLKQAFTEHTRFSCPADLAARELDALETTARRAFDALGCLDVARIDFRLAQDGTPYVLEVNPLPGLSPGFSDLCLIAEGAQMSYAALIGEILKGPLQRTDRSIRDG